MPAFGAGGLDLAVAMAGRPFYLKMPEIVRVNLTGKLPPWVTAKDIIFELLRRLSVKGGVGKIFEYAGRRDQKRRPSRNGPPPPIWERNWRHHFAFPQ